MKNKFIKITVFTLALSLLPLNVSAETLTELKKQKTQTEQELTNIQSKITNLNNEKEKTSEEIDSLNEELTDVLLNIEILKSDIENKEKEVEVAQKDYDKKQKVLDEQYELMKKRVQYLYESGQSTYLETLLSSETLVDAINKVDFSTQIYESDKKLLDKYKDAKESARIAKETLEDEQNELIELEGELKEEQSILETKISEKKEIIKNFDKELESAKEKASKYKKEIQKLQKEVNKKINASKATSKKSVSVTSVSGSGSGVDIANYALKFVGNPYVYGGTSLTNGTDCSGFTQSVYAHFGISIPRTSSGQGSSGTTISQDNIQPGDIVCYYGHVGIYIGNGQIVHASSPSSGIKISNMYYRSIRCIKRYY